MPNYANVLIKVVVILGVINRVSAAIPEHNVLCYSAVAHILNPLVNFCLSGLNRALKINVGLAPGSSL